MLHRLHFILSGKTIRLALVFLLLSGKSFAQGMNNNQNYDKEDLNIILNELGIQTFKFPVRQSANQVFNIVIEEYENKKLISKTSVIEEAIKLFNPLGYDALSFFKPEKDSLYFHRFYFIKSDNRLKLRVKTHNMNLPKEFNFSGKSDYAVNSAYMLTDNGHIETEKSETLLFLYANASSGKDQPLVCSTGLPKEKLIEEFYYLILISMEPYEEK